MGKLHVSTVAVTTTGSNGSATGYASTATLYNAKLWWIYLDYHADAPAGTTDITIAYGTRGGNVYAKANNVTDVLVHPRCAPVNNAASAITNAHSHFVVHNDTLKVTIAESNPLTACVTAYICWEDMAG